jgi:protein-disulfide isomerase
MAYKLKDPATKSDHYIGPLNAPIILVEYGDYECPNCAKAAPWMDQLIQDFKKDLCYVFRHFPMTDIHPHSALAAISAEVAGMKHLFWEMHHLLFENQKDLSGETVVLLAQKLGLDVDRFLIELDKDKVMDDICMHIVSGEESGVEGTPTYFLNGQRLEGNPPYDVIKRDINILLNETQASH